MVYAPCDAYQRYSAGATCSCAVTLYRRAPCSGLQMLSFYNALAVLPKVSSLRPASEFFSKSCFHSIHFPPLLLLIL